MFLETSTQSILCSDLVTPWERSICGRSTDLTTSHQRVFLIHKPSGWSNFATGDTWFSWGWRRQKSTVSGGRAENVRGEPGNEGGDEP